MAQPRVLADRLIAGEGILWDAARVAAANLLLVLCAWIALPLAWTPVPVTGQTFGVMFVAVLLGARRGALALGLYLLEGLAGLPVFQPFGLPGAARFAGPTAGYLLAYPAAAFVTGWLVERSGQLKLGQGDIGTLSDDIRRRSAPRAAPTLWLCGSLVAGELVTFAGGCAWLATAFRMGWSGALTAGAAPFLPGELIKMALVVVAVRGVEHASSSATGTTGG